MTLLNAGTVKTSSFHGTSAAPDGALPTDPWEAMASRAGLSPQAGEVQPADAQDDGAAFPRRLSRKNYVRRSPLSNGENSYLKRTPVHSSPAGLCLPPTSIVSPLFSDSLVFIFSKRTNDRTSITGSTGSSPSGSGLHRLAYRRKRNRLTPRSKSVWDTAAAATDPAGAQADITPRPWPRPVPTRLPSQAATTKGWPIHAGRGRETLPKYATAGVTHERHGILRRGSGA